MLVVLTTETAARFFQIGGSVPPLVASTEYLINTNRISMIKVYDTTHTELDYLLEPQDSNCSPTTLRFTEAASATITHSAVENLANGHIALSVVREYTGETITSETRYFNVADIALGWNDGTLTWFFVSYGGFELRKYACSETLAAIHALM